MKSIRLDDKLHAQLKVSCAIARKPMYECAAQAISDFVNAHQGSVFVCSAVNSTGLQHVFIKQAAHAQLNEFCQTKGRDLQSVFNMAIAQYLKDCPTAIAS